MTVPIDYDALGEGTASVGVALRIGAYPGPFRGDDEVGRRLCQIAANLTHHAAAAGKTLSELQVDFDCPDSKLDGYTTWVRAIRRAVAPTPVVVTALPSWLNRPGFERLTAAADGFILQVHSLERPHAPDATSSLCAPPAARSAVERAARLGRPFRVALPTYGYVIAFDAGSRFIGVQAEGPLPAWPGDAQLRTLRANPSEMAALIRGWTANRPAAMTGVIWYRMPADTDRLNWSWPTLAAVMAGREPAAAASVDIRRVKSGLYDVDIVAAGDAEIALPTSVTISWKSASLVATDALGGYSLERPTPHQAVFLQPGPSPQGLLKPGQRRTIGWLRLSEDTEVTGHVSPEHTEQDAPAATAP